MLYRALLKNAHPIADYVANTISTSDDDQQAQHAANCISSLAEVLLRFPEGERVSRWDLEGIFQDYIKHLRSWLPRHSAN